jgi:hypothetical protein
MTELMLHKLDAAIVWCEQNGADVPHRLLCEHKEILNVILPTIEPRVVDAANPIVEAPEADQVQARLDELSDDERAYIRSVADEIHHIHPDQAVS